MRSLSTLKLSTDTVSSTHGFLLEVSQGLAQLINMQPCPKSEDFDGPRRQSNREVSMAARASMSWSATAPGDEMEDRRRSNSAIASALGQGGVSLRRTLRTIMQSGSAPSGEKGTRQALHAWRRLFTARWWLVPAATRPGEAGVVPAHVPLTRISSLAPNLRARAEICPRLPSQATSTTSDGEAATPPKNRMVPPPASVDEHRGSAGPARQVHFA